MMHLLAPVKTEKTKNKLYQTSLFFRIIALIFARACKFGGSRGLGCNGIEPQKLLSKELCPVYIAGSTSAALRQRFISCKTLINVHSKTVRKFSK